MTYEEWTKEVGLQTGRVLITAERFKEATGRDPENDDLERVNCPVVGGFGHFYCGWNHRLNLPRFEAPD